MGNRLSYIAMQIEPENMAEAFDLLVERAAFSDLDRFGGWSIVRLLAGEWTICLIPDVDLPEPMVAKVRSLSFEREIIVYRVYDVVSFQELVFRRDGEIAWSVAFADGQMHRRGNVPKLFNEFVGKFEGGLRWNRRTKKWVDDSKGIALAAGLFGGSGRRDHLAIGRLAEHLSGYATNLQYDDDLVTDAFRVLPKEVGVEHRNLH